jgi:HAMP domain-containing protein
MRRYPIAGSAGTTMTNPKQKRSLKNLLIVPGFQGKIAFFVFLGGIVCAALNAYLYYSYVVESYDFILRHSSLPQELIDNRYRDLFQFGAALGIVTLLIMLIIAIWALFVTHRAAGSMYHIRRVIEEIRSGNSKARVHLRAKDEFQDVADAFNQLMDEMTKSSKGPNSTG